MMDMEKREGAHTQGEERREHRKGVVMVKIMVVVLLCDGVMVCWWEVGLWVDRYERILREFTGFGCFVSLFGRVCGGSH